MFTVNTVGGPCGERPNAAGHPTVLVVDDEESVADIQALTLRDAYETRVAYGGEEAMAKYDDAVDAVVLDRRMPDLHGDEVLTRIRERGDDTVVVMMTAVDPELNILEMEFDDSLTKPVDAETLRSALDRLLDTRREGDPRLAEFFSLVSKLEILVSELPAGELADSEEYADVKRRARELGEELEETHPDFEEIVETFREINRGSP